MGPVTQGLEVILLGMPAGHASTSVQHHQQPQGKGKHLSQKWLWLGVMAHAWTLYSGSSTEAGALPQVGGQPGGTE